MNLSRYLRKYIKEKTKEHLYIECEIEKVLKQQQRKCEEDQHLHQLRQHQQHSHRVNSTEIYYNYPVAIINQSFSSWQTDRSVLEFKNDTTMNTKYYATLSNFTQSTDLSKSSIIDF